MAKKTSRNDIPEFYRQGDVGLLAFASLDAIREHILPDAHDMYPAEIFETKALPVGAYRPGNIIVEGEVTGHAHRLADGHVYQAAWGALFLEIARATQVVHDEHHSIQLTPDYYLVVRQREYSPEAIRTVID